ncbi:MAG TPA: hypothetical protein VF868_06250 [Bacteroidia bacterium]|jgi:hypothetical protein
MSSFKEKAQIFITGLSIGLLVAGAFFILKLDDYFKELNLYKKMAVNFSIPAAEKPVEKEANVILPSKTKEKSEKTGSLPKVDTTSVTTETPGTSPDTLVNKSDSAYAAIATDDVIVVRKDELTGTKTVEVYTMEPSATKVSAKDSLLQKVSGIRDDKFSGKQMFNVELWSSPLNYKGYKMSKYKIVLYGLSSAESLKLYKLEDIIYMKNAGLIYRLDATGDFKPYERVTDEQIISKLK